MPRIAVKGKEGVVFIRSLLVVCLLCVTGCADDENPVASGGELIVEDVIVGDGASIESSSLRDSMVGSRARISGFSGSLSVAADSEVAG